MKKLKHHKKQEEQEVQKMNKSCIEQFIELLNKKGIIRQIQVAKQITPDVATGEIQNAMDRMCVANTIAKALLRDAELKKAYENAANEIMLDHIMKSIDLKKDENFKFTPQELLAKTISESMMKDFVSKMKDLF